LDLVAIEHIFGRLFEAFRHVSQAGRTGTSAGDDAQPSKRARAPPLERMIVPKYMMILLLFIQPLTFDPHSNNLADCRKSSVSGPPKSANKQVTVLKTATPAAAAATSSSVRGTSWIVLSTTDTWNSSRSVIEFPEGFKNGEADREGTPCVSLATSFP
jgi:hypothetical protein